MVERALNFGLDQKFVFVALVLCMKARMCVPKLASSAGLARFFQSLYNLLIQFDYTIACTFVYTTRVLVPEWLKAVLFGFAGKSDSWKLDCGCMLEQSQERKGEQNHS